MTKINEFNPTKDILEILSGLKKRTKSILLKRFGLGEKNKMTLESIGQAYKITRERVRQIESVALSELKKSPKITELKKYEAMLEDLLNEHGKIMEHNFLMSEFRKKYNLDPIHDNAIEFVLKVSSKFSSIKEDEEIKKTWLLVDADLNFSKKVINSFVLNLEGKGKPVLENELSNNFELEIKDSKTLISYLSLSKKILKNPFNEWGLSDWREIVPKGVKDKAYIVLDKFNKPAHFTKITELINSAKFDCKTAIPQTVHNELIKDQRFVLVGRGMYALKKWGFQQGTVAEIIEQVIKESGKTLSKENIINKVLEQRFVKKNTIVLALQNKQRFQRVDGLYCLAK
ncbi:MAG: sigma factor-like helix-turn-helix DNA-binding protein [Patescibacteria group bacterium]|nr:sigma factor-like helix-turn-helix DNA-binding protein [Patescibacteria group bacterium]